MARRAGFGTVSVHERRNADRFFADLVGAPSSSLRRGRAEAYGLAPEQLHRWPEDASLAGEDQPELVGVTLPARPTTALGGRAFMTEIKDMVGAAREDRILAELRRGNFPDFLRRLTSVEFWYLDSDKTGRTGEFFMMPDVLAIGSNTDWVRIPMGAQTAQRVADAFGMVLPTGKMVQWAFDTSPRPQLRITQTDPAFTRQLAAIPHRQFTNSGQMQMSSPAYLAHHLAIEADPAMAGRRLTEPVAGHKKIVVISPKLFQPGYRGTLAFYGWFYKKSSGEKPRPTQGYAGVPTTHKVGEAGYHEVQYADYSHGVRLIGPRVRSEFGWMSTAAALQHDTLHKVLSAEGKIADPRIPDVPRP